VSNSLNTEGYKKLENPPLLAGGNRQMGMGRKNIEKGNQKRRTI
jgi:hypothetical protein